MDDSGEDGLEDGVDSVQSASIKGMHVDQP